MCRHAVGTAHALSWGRGDPGEPAEVAERFHVCLVSTCSEEASETETDFCFVCRTLENEEHRKHFISPPVPLRGVPLDYPETGQPWVGRRIDYLLYRETSVSSHCTTVRFLSLFHFSLNMSRQALLDRNYERFPTEKLFSLWSFRRWKSLHTWHSWLVWPITSPWASDSTSRWIQKRCEHHVNCPVDHNHRWYISAELLACFKGTNNTNYIWEGNDFNIRLTQSRCMASEEFE